VCADTYIDTYIDISVNYSENFSLNVSRNEFWQLKYCVAFWNYYFVEFLFVRNSIK